VIVVLLPLETLDCVNPESNDTNEGFDDLVRLVARRWRDPCLGRARERLSELSSVCRRRRRGSIVELIASPRRLAALLSVASGI
jgi:hypothetical protein